MLSFLDLILSGVTNLLGAAAAICALVGLVAVAWDFVHKVIVNNKRNASLYRR